MWRYMLDDRSDTDAVTISPPQSLYMPRLPSRLGPKEDGTGSEKRRFRPASLRCVKADIRIHPACAGIVSHADMTSRSRRRWFSAAHIAAGGGTFSPASVTLSSWDPDTTLMNRLMPHQRRSRRRDIPRRPENTGAAMGLRFRRNGSTPQIAELTPLPRPARHADVLDHDGVHSGLQVCRKARRCFETWSNSIARSPTVPNVCLKLGGLGMRTMGWLENAEDPPSSMHWPRLGNPTSRLALRPLVAIAVCSRATFLSTRILQHQVFWKRLQDPR
jgi:hypothetical protein